MSKNLVAAVAAEIRDQLDHRGWSGRELARRTGIKPATVASKLAGTHAFDLADLDAIADALQTTASALIVRSEERARHV